MKEQLPMAAAAIQAIGNTKWHWPKVRIGMNTAIATFSLMLTGAHLRQGC
jgi:hypothetical protein